MSGVEKHDSAERNVTQFWYSMWGSKRNQVRQLADIDGDVDRYRKTKRKDPNSEEGDTGEY